MSGRGGARLSVWWGHHVRYGWVHAGRSVRWELAGPVGQIDMWGLLRGTPVWSVGGTHCQVGHWELVGPIGQVCYIRLAGLRLTCGPQP
jgi:hypothetical protein